MNDKGRIKKEIDLEIVVDILFDEILEVDYKGLSKAERYIRMKNHQEKTISILAESTARIFEEFIAEGIARELVEKD